jgi:hypothetical protein
LKGFTKKFDLDLDSDFKLPKILNNYKGGEVEKMNISGIDNNGNIDYIEPVTPKSPLDSAKKRPVSEQFSVNPMSTRASTVKVKVNNEPITMHMESLNKSISSEGVGDQRIWQSLLSKGQTIVYTSMIGKKNPIGITLNRQLILTENPVSLFYVDHKSMTIKGYVDWNENSVPIARTVCSSFYLNKYFF